jgi:hypothetical protein
MFPITYSLLTRQATNKEGTEGQARKIKTKSNEETINVNTKCK